MKRLILILTLIAPAVQADIFICLQADGTTAFAHVPCRVTPKKTTVTTISAKAEIVVIEPLSLTRVDTDVSGLESEFDRLHAARESEIADAPFSASEPNALATLKQDIRASYQLRINDRLKELLRLRNEKKGLKQIANCLTRQQPKPISPAHLTTANRFAAQLKQPDFGQSALKVCNFILA